MSRTPEEQLLYDIFSNEHEETMPEWTHVYIIYSADTVAEYPFIESMAPARMLKPYESQHDITGIVDAFTLTEGDEQYDYGYLSDNGRRPEYLPYADRDDKTEYVNSHNGMHRKWVGELTREQWKVFAKAYCIDLDDNDIPEDYEDTMGSLTEYGIIPAIAVDNTDGWGCAYYGSQPVIDSQMYLSFGVR